MAKIGTAHIEVKPVLNEAALDEIVARIEAAVKAGVEAGMAAARPIYGDVHVVATNMEALMSEAQMEARQRATSGVPRERRERGRGNQ